MKLKPWPDVQEMGKEIDKLKGKGSNLVDKIKALKKPYTDVVKALASAEKRVTELKRKQTLIDGSVKEFLQDIRSEKDRLTNANRIVNELNREREENRKAIAGFVDEGKKLDKSIRLIKVRKGNYEANMGESEELPKIIKKLRDQEVLRDENKAALEFATEAGFVFREWLAQAERGKKRLSDSLKNYEIQEGDFQRTLRIQKGIQSHLAAAKARVSTLEKKRKDLEMKARALGDALQNVLCQMQRWDYERECAYKDWPVLQKKKELTDIVPKKYWPD